jgi:hypothetical protein
LGQRQPYPLAPDCLTERCSRKRWVLRSDDAKMLAQIDAVFVTVERNGGSRRPSGKSLLFADLRIDPNHP